MQDDPKANMILGDPNPVGRALLAATRIAAYVGGAILVLLVVMSVVSIVGRKLFAMPVRGDVEMLQMGGAVAVACLLSYCQMMNENVRVDFFTDGLSPRARGILDAFGAVLVAAFAALVAWRSWVKAVDTMEIGETSALLHVPVALPQFLIVPGFVLLCLAGLYRAWRFLFPVEGK